MKRILIILLTIFSFVVSAYAQNFQVDGLSYNVTKQPGDETPGEVEVTGGEIKEEIEIPESVTYNDVTYTVTSIGNAAFEGRRNSGNCTKKYIIPGTVRSIGENAFYDNYYLEEVEFNEGLQTIGASAFGYNFLLKEIRIPSTVTYIGNSTFITNQQNRATISCLAETPPSIQPSSFSGRTEATLHVVTTCADSYEEAENWKDFSEISDDIIFTHRCYAPKFSLDNNLLTVSCKTEGATIYYTTDGTVPNENGIRYTSPISYSTNQIIRAIAIAEGMENSAIRTFSNGEQIGSVTDEQGVQYTLEQADNGSFYYSVTGHTDEMIAEIVIPDNLGGCPVKIIGEWVFGYCTGLTSITISNSVSTIGNSAFYGCSNLSTVILGSQLMTIGENVFGNCTSLSSVTIPSSVNSIGTNAFYNCSGLKIVTSEISTPFDVNAFNRFDASLVVPKGSRADYKKANGWNFAFTFEEDETIYDRTQTDGQGLCYTLRQADNGSFYYSITGHSDELNAEIVIPADLEGCPVTNIKEWVFNGCSNLSSITIPESVTSIGDYAFRECSGLKMVISEISTPFDVNAFSDSFNATLLVPQGSRADYKNTNGWDFAFTFEEGETIYDREQADEQGLCYTLRQADDDSFYYSVTGHTDELNAEIVIPADLDGCPVKTIEDGIHDTSNPSGVFRNCSILTSLTIGSNIIHIGSYAFVNCTNLESIIIPYGVTTIGGGAFMGCSGLTSVSIPNSVTNIEDGTCFLSCYYTGQGITRYDYYGAFYGCSGLSSVKIGNGVRRIGNGTFEGCENLISVNMGKNVNHIGENAFRNCYNLVSVKLPDELPSIGTFAFDGCRSLTSVDIPSSVKSIGVYAFNGCRALASVNFEDGITTIGSFAFQDCALSSIVIPNSVTTIGKYTFSGNRNLVTVILGDGINEIGEYTFNECRALTSVNISEGVTTIGSYTFKSCYALTSVNIPDGVTSIGSYAFRDCSLLTSIKLPESLTTLGDYVFPNSMKSIELPDAFTVISEGLFIGNNFQYIKLGNSVKTIGKNAFGSSELILEIGTSTPPTIDKDAFPWVEFLEDINVIVPNAKAETAYHKAAVWEDMTFSNQNNVSEVTVETPGDLSFELITQCDMTPAKVVNLKVNGTINAEDFNQMLVNMKSLLHLDLSGCDITSIPDNALNGKTQLQELTLPTSLQTIGSNAFRDCPYLTGELEIPSTVTSIGESAFVGTAYTSVKLPNTLKTIGNDAFYNLPLKQRLSLPGSVNTVGERAFEGTKIESLTIPRSVTSIGNRAFANTQIGSLTIIDGVKSIGDEAFANSPIQGHVTIPDGVTYLGDGAFRNTQISTVFLPNSVTTLSQGLFQGCPNLNLLYVPDNYTAMNSSVFDGCESLNILRLSANTETMGSYSLQNTPLEYIKIPSKVETLPTGVLRNCTKLESLALPAELKTVEGEALYGCTALRNMSVEATTPPVIKNRSAIRGINTDKCLISIPTSAYRSYVLAEYWGQFVQMRNDIAVETAGNGEIAFESVVEDEDEEEVSETKEFGPRRATARARRRAQLATDEESMTYANNGSSVYVPQQGQVRFYIIPGDGEEILSATLDGVDIMPYIVDGVYTATADKKNAKLVVKFSGQGSAVMAGDVNGDGKVNITDAVGIVNYLLGNPSDGFVEAAADVNNDGSITITDAVAVVNMILESGNSVRELMPLLNNEMIPE